jgi:hypothetical protein
VLRIAFLRLSRVVIGLVSAARLGRHSLSRLQSLHTPSALGRSGVVFQLHEPCCLYSIKAADMTSFVIIDDAAFLDFGDNCKSTSEIFLNGDTSLRPS